MSFVREGGVAAVLAGGCARRMGRDKALLEAGGVTLLEWVVRRLAARYATILISVSSEEPAERLRAPLARLEACGIAVRLVADLRPGRQGPLAALEAVLSAAGAASVFTVSVDQPGVDVELAAALEDRLERSEAFGAVPVWRGRAEPTHAVYRPELLRRVEMLLDAGERRLQALAEAPEVSLLEVVGPQEAPPSGGLRLARAPEEVFRNLNTPLDYASFLERLGPSGAP